MLHLAVGTPMHAGQCTGLFHSSFARLQRSLVADGHHLSQITIGNESLIGRGRNSIVWHFLQSEATHLLFCDGDIGFRVGDVARMLASDKPVIVAPCPLKQINWKRVHQAVLDGYRPDELYRFTAFFNLVHRGERRLVSADEPFEVKRGGTGLMLVQRSVFEDLAPATETYANRCPGDAMPIGARVHNFFPSYVADDDLLSEDFGFCEAFRGIGGTIWAAPWCEVDHVGAYRFHGSYADCFAERAPLKQSPESVEV